MADVDVNGNSLELTIEDEKVKAIGNIPVGGGDESVWTDETFNALGDDNGENILDENDEAIGDEDAETLWATRDGVGFKAERAEADINGNSLELHVNAEGKIDKIGNKYIEGTGEAPVDAYSKEETDALLDDKQDNLTFDGTYDATTNPVATLSTIESSIPQNLPAAKNGTDTSLVTTGNKYTWDDWTAIDIDVPPADGIRIGGKKYPYKQFGNTIWMIENLKYDINDSSNLTIQNGQYYYRARYLFGEEFAKIIPPGWRVPTIADRDNLNAILVRTTDPKAYLKQNFNVEPCSMYNGYGTWPGSFVLSWEFCVGTYGNGPCGGILITEYGYSNSNNLGGAGLDVSFCIRLCKDAT